MRSGLMEPTSLRSTLLSAVALERQRPGTIGRCMRTAAPWTSGLSATDRRRFLEELMSASLEADDVISRWHQIANEGAA